MKRYKEAFYKGFRAGEFFDELEWGKVSTRKGISRNAKRQGVVVKNKKFIDLIPSDGHQEEVFEDMATWNNGLQFVKLILWLPGFNQVLVNQILQIWQED